MRRALASLLVMAASVGPPRAAGESSQSPAALPRIDSYRAADIASLRSGFSHPPREAGPWVYWFWFDNVVSRPEITSELQEMAEAGFAGVELRCVSMRGFSGGSPGPWFDPQGWERLGQERLAYLSPAFVDVLEHTLDEARRLGLRFSINLGMGWPPGGRWITEAHRSKHLVSRSEVVHGPARLEDDRALEVPPGARVAAWRLVDERRVDRGSYLELNGGDSSGQVEWDVPEGRWLVGVFETVPGGLVDKGEGAEVDPASKEAVLFHLNELFGRLEPQLSRFFGSTLVDVASDSWEYARHREGRYWSPALLGSAPEVLGYPLEPRMHALLGYGPDADETLADIARLERELVHRNYFETVARFVHDRRLRHRPQVYGRGLERDLLTAYAIADVPELEEGVYVPEAVWSARTLGKPFVSAEAFTHASIRHGNLRYDAHRGEYNSTVDPEKMWRTTPALLRALSNAHFARGINRIQTHSFSYSPPGVPEPGWRMYAEIHLNRNVPWWPELKRHNLWAARNQFVLQAGAPVADALVYPVEPNPIDGPFNMSPEQPRAATDAVDAANEAALIRLADGYGETGYAVRRVVLRDDIRTPAEAEALLKLARAGVPIWCSQAMPDRWSALRGSGSSEISRLRDAFQRAAQDEKVVDARGRGWAEIVGADRTVRWPDSAKLSFQHRRVSGAEIYFVASWEESFSGEVTFPHDSTMPELWDADTGRTSRPSGVAVRHGRTAIPLELGPNDSKIVVFADDEPHEAAAAPRAGSAVLAEQLIFPPGRCGSFRATRPRSPRPSAGRGRLFRGLAGRAPGCGHLVVQERERRLDRAGGSRHGDRGWRHPLLLPEPGPVPASKRTSSPLLQGGPRPRIRSALPGSPGG